MTYTINVNQSELTALSLFSGAGGIDVGASQAGFNVRACIEIDRHCLSTLRHNIEKQKKDTLVLGEDIRRINPKALMNDLGFVPNELDLLFGGSPCQAFSQMGKQESLNDDRGLLLFEIVRFAEIFKPKAILIEQVKGLLNACDTKGTRGGVLKLLLLRLERLGYVPKWKVIKAADYGVPQLRERVFIVATEKPNGFEFPMPSHSSMNDIVPFFPTLPYETVGRAIQGLGRPSRKKDRIDSHVDVTPAREAERMHGVPEGEYLGGQLHFPKDKVMNLKIKDTTKFRRLSRYLPSNTLRCGEIFFHPISDRYLTPREYMRLHGYPDDYELKGPIRRRSGTVKDLDQHRQVANSVPPPIAKILAKEIRRVIECRKSSNSLAIA